MNIASKAAPYALAIIFVAVVWTWHASMIGTGFIVRSDEFATLDRSGSLITTGDWWTVHSRNLPSFKKPPLQYWMTAGFMQSGLDLTTALRLPSMIFALGCFAAVGLLARVILPANPWAVPAAILIFAGSTDFWSYAASAMLDTGAVFFATVAIAAAIRAVERPGWWYVSAAAMALGALQKAPIGLVLVFGYVLALHWTRRWHGIGTGAIRGHPLFRRAIRIAIAAVLAWPLLQLLRHGSITVIEDLFAQTVGRFAPLGIDEDLGDVSGLWRLVMGDEPILRGIGIAALAWLPFRLRKPVLLPLPILFLAYVVLMYLALGNVYGRYSLIFVPWFAVAIAAVILSAPLPAVARGAAVVLVSALSLGPLKPAGELSLAPRTEMMARLDILARVGEALGPDEDLVVCDWTGTKMPPGAVTWFASNARPYAMPLSPESFRRLLTEGELSAPLRGLCTPEEIETISGMLAGFSEIGRAGGFVHWTATGTRLAQ